MISENNIGEYMLECMFANCNLGDKWTKWKTPKLPTGEASSMLDNQSLNHKLTLGANVGELRKKLVKFDRTKITKNWSEQDPEFSKMEWDAYCDS